MYTINDVKYRILCKSIIDKKTCKYGELCLYAHNIIEQNIDHLNLEVIKLITSNCPLNHIVLTDIKTNILYKKLYSFTSLCHNCINNNCLGGFNCKEGSNCKDLLICKNNFLFGECSNDLLKTNYSKIIISKFPELNNKQYMGCKNGHHLTIRSFQPYIIQEQKVDELLNDYDSDYYVSEEEEDNIQIIDIDHVEEVEKNTSEKNTIRGFRLLD